MHHYWKLLRATLAALLTLIAVAGAAIAGTFQEFDEGIAAENRGDYAAAYRVYRALAEQGYVNAQVSLARMYYEGKGVLQNYAEAATWYRKAADQGDVVAQFELGDMYYNGEGVPQSDADAATWYRKAAEQGHGYACYNLAIMYRDGKGVQQNYAEAVKWFQRAAVDRDWDLAKLTLGNMYRDGQGVPQDYAEALKWYQKAAGGPGNFIAEFNLGVMYRDGKGVQQNYAEAMKWFRKAADRWGNILPGSGFLGMPPRSWAEAVRSSAEAMAKARTPVEYDAAEMFSHFAEAVANARYNLAIMYRNGKGVQQNYAEALKWFRLAAEQGQADAQYNLGLMYRDGERVPQDYVQAYMWLNLAVSQIPASEKENCDVTAKERDRVASRMTPAQIAEAQRLTRAYEPSAASSAWIEVPLTKVGGTFVVPVQINDAITLSFTIDSGAADVSVPLDVFSTLRRTGTIQDSDISGQQTYVLADGSMRQAVMFTIRSLKVGDILVENVKGIVAPAQGSLLLGQSFLEHFKSWSIDNTKHVLLLEPQQALP